LLDAACSGMGWEVRSLLLSASSWSFSCDLQAISLSTQLCQILDEGMLAANAEMSGRLSVSSSNYSCIVQVHVLGDDEPRQARRNRFGLALSGN